jgi:hypothetical protein
MGPCLPEDNGNTTPVPLLGPGENVNNQDGGRDRRRDDDAHHVNDAQGQQQQQQIDPEILIIDQQQEQQDFWATSVGYTPLADWSLQQQDDETGSDGDRVSTWIVSMGPSSSNDDGESSDNDEQEGRDGPRAFRGSFVVNPSAFDVLSGGDGNDKDDKSHSHGADRENTSAMDSTVNGNNPYSTSICTDFDDVAANALLALDNEYQRVIIREITGPEDGSGTGGADSSSCATHKDVDEDIKIIAAAFDRRNGEMQRELLRQELSYPRETDILPSGLPDSGATVLRPSDTKQKDERPLDLNALKRAIDELSVKNKDNNFHQKFAAWQQKQKQAQTNTMAVEVPPHKLIPQTSCKAFTKSTNKAKEATANLTRSATLAEAIVRILLSKSSTSSNPSVLAIDIVGVDHVECESIDMIQATFRPIVGWLRLRTDLPYQQVHFRLIGRELSFSGDVTHGVPVDLLPIHPTNTACTLLEATATCYSGMYHTFLDEGAIDVNSSVGTPDLLVAFNAGIWGYQDWVPTICYLAGRKSSGGGLPSIPLPPIPMVITAYTLEECEEDYEVIATNVKCVASNDDDKKNESGLARVLWEPEMNPFGSRTIRETKSSNQVYRENAYWQAWLLGGDPLNH